MAQLSFDLTFAGVPFLLDTARVIRAHQPHEEYEDNKNLPPEKHQPEEDFIDELNRLIPFQYLQEFTPPTNYPNRNTDALAVQYPLGPQPDRLLRINDWYYPTTASRWSVFRGLVTSSMAKEMLKQTGGTNPKTFKMKCVPVSPSTLANDDDNYTIETSMYMLPPRPLAEHGGNFDGLYLITLVDERYWWQFNPISIKPTGSTTWASLLTSIASTLGVTINYSAIAAVYGTPEPDSQLWVNRENTAALFDAVAFNIGRTVVRLMDGTYILRTTSETQTILNANRGNATRVVRTAGGDIFNSGMQRLPIGDLLPSRNAALPRSVDVTFPKYVHGDDPVPHFLNARYANQRPSAWYEESFGDAFVVNVPVASGGALTSGLSGTIATHALHNTAKAIYNTEAAATGNPINVSGLTALAMQMTQDYCESQVAAALDEVYPGTFKWTPEAIHDIIWTWSARARMGTTRVLRAEWNQVIRDFQNSATAFSGGSTVPKGVGGPSVAQTWRDSFSGSIVSGVISNTLNGSITAAATSVTFTNSDYFPTQNRWRGIINSGATDQEIVLFEGTSGNEVVGIVYRGIDGTVAAAHANASVVAQVNTDPTYGVNLITHEKMQFAYPAEWTSGGIQGVRVVPQTQTVQVLSNSGFTLRNITHWSGRVLSYSPSQTSGYQFPNEELVWVVDRNDAFLASGHKYDGQFAGHSASGTIRPIYLVDGTCCDDHWALTNCCHCKMATSLYASLQSSGTNIVEIPINWSAADSYWIGSGTLVATSIGVKLACFVSGSTYFSVNLACTGGNVDTGPPDWGSQCSPTNLVYGLVNAPVDVSGLCFASTVHIQISECGNGGANVGGIVA